MTETLQNIDASTLLFFNSAHCSFFDSFMSLYSGRFIWIPMYAALLIMMLRRYSPMKVLFLLIGIAFSIVIADQLCATILRPIFHRLRPSNLDNPLSAAIHIVNGYRGGAYGFPSCHAANSFALATFASMMLKRRSFTLFIVCWAIINCYSRMYLGVHYPGDLIAGGTIGALTGALCYSLVMFLYGKMSHSRNSEESRPLLDIKNGIITDIKLFKDINLMELVGFVTLFAIIVVSLA